MKKRFFTAGLAALLSLSALCSCEVDTGDIGGGVKIPSTAVTIQLEGDAVSCTDPSVYVEEGKVTITSHGTYVVTGTWNDGQIYVDCVDAGEVDIVLDNAAITNNDQACIVFNKAQTAILTLKEGSANTLTDGVRYVYENPMEDEPDGALFSKEDLLITGDGGLTVNGNYKNGIVSKDGLTIDGGTIEVASADHGIKGKDFVVLNGGNITVEAVGDGIKSTNEEREDRGYIKMNGGAVTIYSDDEAICAITDITVNGGTLNIRSTNNGIRTSGDLVVNGGVVDVEATDTPIEARDVVLADGATLTVLGYPYKK